MKNRNVLFLMLIAFCLLVITATNAAGKELKSVREALIEDKDLKSSLFPADIRESELSILRGLKDVCLYIEPLSSELKNLGIGENELYSDIEKQLQELGIKVIIEKVALKRLEKSTITVNVESKMNKKAGISAVLVSFQLWEKVLLLRIEKLAVQTSSDRATTGASTMDYFSAVIWQRTRFDLCKPEELSKAVKKLSEECIKEFGQEYITAAASTGGKAGRKEEMMNGVVRYLDFEGGFYGLVTDDGQKFDPLNLPAEFRKDGLRVRFAVREKEGIGSFHMWGTIVEILGIEMEGKEKEGKDELQWLGHASFRIIVDGKVIYIDPWKLKEANHDADIVLVSHGHSDHYSPADIAKVSKADTKLIASSDVIEKEGTGKAVLPGERIDVEGIKIMAVAAYNIAKRFHPKENRFVGFIIEAGLVRIYYAGDTDLIEEMKQLKNIDVALLPVGGRYTMDAKEAAEATKIIKPKKAVPYHYGDIIGSRRDAEQFAKEAGCEVILLKPNDIIKVSD